MTADPNAELLAAIDRYEAATRPPPSPLVNIVLCVVLDTLGGVAGVVDRLTRRLRG